MSRSATAVNLLDLPQTALNAGFADVDLRRGRVLMSQVSALEVIPVESEQNGVLAWRVAGQVQGSMREPYQVKIGVVFERRGQTWQIDPSCSCPVDGPCKHAVAVLLRATQPDAANAAVERNLDSFMAELKAELHATPKSIDIHSNQGELRLYLQVCLQAEPGIFAELCARPLLAVMEDGRLHVQAELSPYRILPAHAALLSGMDAAALKELAVFEPVLISGRHWYPLNGARGLIVIEEALQWQRLVLTGSMGHALTLGHPRTVELRFRVDGNARQTLTAVVVSQAGAASNTILLQTEPVSYLDRDSLEIGRTRLPVPLSQLRNALAFAPMSPLQLLAKLPEIQAILGAATPPPVSLSERTAQDVQPIPILKISLSADKEALINRRVKRRIGYARQMVELEQEPVTISQYARGVQRVKADQLTRFPPDLALIDQWTAELRASGLERVQDRLGVGHVDGDWLINADYDEQTLSEFCFIGVPKLKALGWRIEYSAGFPLKLIDQQTEIVAEITEVEGGRYFDLALDIDVGGQRIALLPILRASLEQGRYTNLPDNPEAIVALYLPDGPVPIAAGRLRLMLSVLAEMGSVASARLPRMRAGLLSELDHGLAEQLRWRGADSIRTLAERLAGVNGLVELEAPKSFKATLRGYQKLGLAWLKFLRDTEMAGILADDMGLGKTVQVLAHVLLERENGSAHLPVLVVAPTSVLPNWRAEIQRFAPQLKTLTLSGSKRAQASQLIPSHDIVLTSYALLGRDLARLVGYEFDLLVLDESQLVKNPNTLAAKAARQIHAKHRLCLTGTPLENNLTELWAQFDFLMPGFLGSKVGFQKNFRTPIEKRRDSDVSTRLRQRIAPFLLRRTKDQVVSELPPKSIIVKRVELDGKQRDLYETLRLSLKAQVAMAVAERGQEKGRISLLDALLKLRQACCDPRLLKLETLVNAPSAKFDQLFDMLSALIAEGRRILLFSQFTSMLALIEAECIRRKFKFTMLTGQTDDRDAPVKLFQSLQVPLFLISLRAGGVGLNLTAADTVIHYDPWWNPAVEEQATDRAYRIGQQKPVFVYRLIAAGTVEERIEEMKVRKRELADLMLEDAVLSAWSTEELMSLLDA